jgi:hypothetical protein
VTTLVVIRRSGIHDAGGRLLYQHGDELLPGLLSQETIAHWLDEGWLKEIDSTGRPSLYRLFHRFTGCKEEQPLTPKQIAAHTLEE